MHPMDYFAKASAVKAGHCFIVMPFAREFDKVHATIKGALGSEGLNVIAHRADESVTSGAVMTDVMRNLAESELVIVDLTGRNANVFYELGIAHTVRCAQSVLLITQNINDIPFDVKSYRCLEYALTPRGLSQLREKLSHFVNTEILPTRFNFRLAAGQSWKSDEVVGKDRWFYTFAVCDVSLARDGVRFRLDVFRHSPKGSVKRVYGQPQRALRAEETVPIPNIPYALKVDGVSLEQAVFCVCHPVELAAVASS